MDVRWGVGNLWDVGWSILKNGPRLDCPARAWPSEIVAGGFSGGWGKWPLIFLMSEKCLPFQGIWEEGPSMAPWRLGDSAVFPPAHLVET